MVSGSPADKVQLSVGDVVFHGGGVDGNYPKGFPSAAWDAVKAGSVVYLVRDGQTVPMGYREDPPP